MPTLKNLSAGDLVLPRGSARIAPDESVEVSTKTLGLPGVSYWLSSGAAEVVKPKRKQKGKGDG